jgi:hypothetical protein
LASLIKWAVLFKLVELIVWIVLGVLVAATAIVIMMRGWRDQLGLAVTVRFGCEIAVTTNANIVAMLMLVMMVVVVVWSKEK